MAKKMVKDLKIDDTVWYCEYHTVKTSRIYSISTREIKSFGAKLEVKEGDQTSWVLKDKYNTLYFLNKVDAFLHQREKLIASAKKRRSEIIELTTKLSNIEEALEENHKELIKIQKQ